MKAPDLSWLIVRPDPRSLSPYDGHAEPASTSSPSHGAAAVDGPQQRDHASMSSLSTPYDEGIHSKDIAAIVGAGHKAVVIENGGYDHQYPQHDQPTGPANSLSTNDIARRARASARLHPPRDMPIEPLTDHTSRQYMPVYLWRLCHWFITLPYVGAVCRYFAATRLSDPPHYAPRMWRIIPLEKAERLLVRHTRPLRYPWMLWLFLSGWFLGTVFLVRAAWYNAGSGQTTPWASGGSAYWQANDGCGFGGVECGPFSGFNASYRCPSSQLSVKLLNNRAVGPLAVFYQPLVVGGGDELATYRADSWLCAAAIHHGVFSNGNGGCLTIQAIGNYTNFTASTANGISSVAFPSTFPFAFRFLPVSQTDCKDLRNGILIWDVVMSAVFGFVIRASAGVWYWVAVCFGYWQITLASDPRDFPPVLADAFGDFLPTLFVCYVFYRFAFRWVLPSFNDKVVDRTILFLGPFWIALLTNYTFDLLPIDRLTAADIKNTPGGLVAIIIIVIIVVMVAINQLRVARSAGWLPYYLGYYALGGLIVLVLSQLPGLELRIHHYIIAIVLLPGTAFPTRVSLIYQALLLGLFLNGIARWGFDSILQTPAELRRDAALGSDLPSFNLASIDTVSKLITWNAIPSNLTSSWNGFALIVNDVLEYSGTASNFSMANYSTAVPWFLRLAYQQNGASGDFTRAGIAWLGNGTWVSPAPGPS